MSPVLIACLASSIAGCGAAESESAPLGAAASAVSALSVVAASPTIGADDCRGGFASPQCTARPFDRARNVAYSGNGVALPAVAKDTIPGYAAIHAPAHLNDGFYGNGSSWIANSAGSWVKIDLGAPTRIDGIRFGRDRTGGFDDRDPGQFVVSVASADAVYANGDDSNDAAEYTTVLDSSQHGYSGVVFGAETIRASFAPVVARFVKLQVGNMGTAIDEIEIFGETATTVAASAAAGADQCRAGYASPQCLVRPFDAGADAALAGGSVPGAVAKDCIGGHPGIHEPRNVNDGLHGNGSSWIAASAGSWVKIDLGEVMPINSVQFGRDRIGAFDDRDPGRVTIAVATTEDVYANGNDQSDAWEYTPVFDSAHTGFLGAFAGPETIEAGFAAVSARYVKVQVGNAGAAIDEIEVRRACAPGQALLDARTCATLVPWDGSPLPDGARIAMRAKKRFVKNYDLESFGPAWVGLTHYRFNSSVPDYDYLDARLPSPTKGAVFTVTAIPRGPTEYLNGNNPSAYQKLLLRASTGAYVSTESGGKLVASTGLGGAPIWILDLTRGTSAGLYYTGYAYGNGGTIPSDYPSLHGAHFWAVNGLTMVGIHAGGFSDASFFELFLVQ